MKITKQQLREMVEKVVSEATISPVVKKAVESDADLEELLQAMAEKIESLEDEIERRKKEYANATARMSQITGKE